MCGIVGYIGERDAMPILLDCLGRLEYRGYDSAGMGVIDNGRLEVRRSVGKSACLGRILEKDPLEGRVGIAHTRWATHGKPADENAHPHSDCSRTLAVVHNGIIENFHALRASLEQNGHRFQSQTDTEVIAHLLENSLNGDMLATARKTIAALRGGYALGIISQTAPDTIIAARNGGPPLVVGCSDHGSFITSDIAAILGYTRNVRVLEDGEMAVLTRGDAEIVALDGARVDREMVTIPWDAEAAEKAGYPHFMLKEIHEQPDAIEKTVTAQADLESGTVVFPEGGFSDKELAAVSRITLLACGTSWHAALVGKYMIELLARTRVEVDIASEYRYRNPIVDEDTLTVGISQSGETADTLGALRQARENGSTVLAVCNVVGSSMSRESDAVIYTHAGPEIGVASTKAFTSQLASLALFAVALGRAKGTLSENGARRVLKELKSLPGHMEKILAQGDALKELAGSLQGFGNFLYLGRGINFPLALEGALKLKEISYIHAEGYAAGEMKHGPIALIDENLPVVVIAPQGALYDKLVGCIEEVKARDGIVFALASEGDEDIASRVDHVFYLPKLSELLLPIVVAVPLQLLAYHVAVLRDCDVDQPRNLAKSVTVE